MLMLITLAAKVLSVKTRTLDDWKLNVCLIQ